MKNSSDNLGVPILIIGKNGQLGQSLQALVSDATSQTIMLAGPEFQFVGRDELDLSSNASIVDYFVDKDFSAIVNCAAYTAVDQAESEPELANQLNHFAVAQLADIAKQQSIPMIHISTDYVFNGQGFKPYLVSDATDPKNQYGITKLKGEQAMLASGCRGAIIRTSWLYSEFGHNFVKTMLRLGRERERLDVVADQLGSPTYAMDLAQVVLSLLQFSDDLSGISPHTGVQIYHYCNKGVCSWYDLAKTLLELSHSDCKINPIESKDYPTPAKRPSYSVLDTTNIKHALPGLVIRHWRDALQTCLNQLDAKP
jgi:dTDP-4-dehydrorhamnose reductase